jgi:hypothetical protein
MPSFIVVGIAHDEEPPLGADIATYGCHVYTIPEGN